MNYGGIKGTIITADANDKINITENGVIITDSAGTIQGVFAHDALPPGYVREAPLPIQDPRREKIHCGAGG